MRIACYLDKIVIKVVDQSSVKQIVMHIAASYNTFQMYVSTINTCNKKQIGSWETIAAAEDLNILQNCGGGG